MMKKKNKDGDSKGVNIRDIFNNNKFVFVISLLMALAIWMTVSPVRTVMIGVTVNIDANDTSAGSLGLDVIEGQGQNVNVAVKGKWYSISSLTADDIAIGYSLSNVTKAGDYELTLTAEKVSTAKDFEISYISPEKLKVSFDFIKTKDFEVIVTTNNVKAKEGYILGTPVINSEQSIISLTGPMSIIERIDTVVARVEIDEELGASESYETELQFLNKKGKTVNTDLLTLPFNTVSVTVPVNKSKTVPLKASFKNQPDYYIENPISYKLSESSVTIIGTAEIVDTIQELTLDPIDFSSIREGSTSFNFDLNLPSGVSLVDDVGKIEVTINMPDLDSATLEVSKFVGVNGDSDVNASVITKKKTVTVVGPSSIIKNISSSQVYLRYDLSNASNSGEMVVNAILKSDKYDNIWGYGEYQIQIKLK